MRRTDGRTYTVQYFERVVFELHPENAAPYDVLLQLLGVFYYEQKYGGTQPEEIPNDEPGSSAFEQTGQRLGGSWLDVSVRLLPLAIPGAILSLDVPAFVCGSFGAQSRSGIPRELRTFAEIWR